MKGEKEWFERTFKIQGTIYAKILVFVFFTKLKKGSKYFEKNRIHNVGTYIWLDLEKGGK